MRPRVLLLLLLNLLLIFLGWPSKMPVRSSLAPLPVRFANGPKCPEISPLRLSNVFDGEGLVLQCGEHRATRVWGFAAAGCSISAAFVPLGGPSSLGSSSSSFASLAYSETGSFVATFSALPCGVEGVLALASSSGAALNASVRLGHVLFCSGQSNMVGLSLLPGFEADSSVAASLQVESPATAAEAASQPLPIYGLRVGMRDAWAKDAPLAELASAPELPWAALPTPASPAAASFSAVCWWWGRALARHHFPAGTPIGLIEAAWGGSWVQAWSTPASNAQCSAPPFGAPWAPGHFSSLHNALVAPFQVGPLALTALGWYQGESNGLVGQGGEYYRCALGALVESWREGFAAPGLPVAVVELAPFAREGGGGAWGAGWVSVRAAQLAAALQRPTLAPFALIPTSDVRDLPGDIHPRRKRVIGERLAQATREMLCGGGSGGSGGSLPEPVVVTGPVHLSSRAVEGGLVVHFSQAVVPQEDAEGGCSGGVDSRSCGRLEMRDASGKWVPAQWDLEAAAAAGAAAGSSSGGGSAQLLLRPLPGEAQAQGPFSGSRSGRGMWPACSIVGAASGWPAHPWEAGVDGGS